MSTHKAKRIDNGKWIEGWLDGSGKPPCIWVSTGKQLGDPITIDPETLCEGVRGTEFFEGDEVERNGVVGYIEFDERILFWIIKNAEGKFLDYAYVNTWKPTGRNKHD